MGIGYSEDNNQIVSTDLINPGAEVTLFTVQKADAYANILFSSSHNKHNSLVDCLHSCPEMSTGQKFWKPSMDLVKAGY
ncbi:hypothetical protein O181_074396 [Austropuccinia psidii MF-1]|uniref:Uncharacterized protein n=1 Tax=Austropuccinia psidii MF-1 TaxID=1389203 RepID=A0A9Q3FCT7_9BASI|nr:hypothetical protein [Austropuccinia psidii MF-1]